MPLLFYANTIIVTIDQTYSAEKEAELKSLANRVAVNVRSINYINDESKRMVFDENLDDESARYSVRIIVTDSRGKVLYDSARAGLGQTLLSPEILSALNNKTITSMQSSGEYMTAAVSVPSALGTEVSGAVLVVSSVKDKLSMLSTIRQRLVLLTVLLSMIVLILVFFFSQLIIEPLKNILEVVKKISEGHLDQRVKFYGYDEFSELGASFNDMTVKLEAVDATRSEFVSNVSHELKTPLSSIKVLSESLLLQDDVPNETYREFLRDINSEVDRMTTIVNELLTLVLLDRTEQAVEMKVFKLNNMLEDIVKRQMPLAAQKNITLSLEESGQVSIEGDEMKLSLAISNLVENGIKYTNIDGSVTVSLEADSQNAYITVTDTGIGISEAEQGKVFTRFYRVDKTRDRDTGGTGLGLAITHKTVLLHNGSIRIVSRENEGSRFIVRLPVGSKPGLRKEH